MTLPESKPIIFGEVLFDEFEDGSQVLGGAPFNVAWHLKGFGLEPSFVSRIGEDEAGKQVLAAMREWGMDCEGIQRDKKYATGCVTIGLVDGQPNFDICHPSAYDYINQNELDELLTSLQPTLLYHGSLAARSDVSAQTLNALKASNIPTFVDINLREPWWKKEQVLKLLQGSAWVKLNDDELGLLSSQKNISLDKQAEHFKQENNVQNLVVTRGSEGAWLFSEDHLIETEPETVSNMMDTVGAGDAFSAVCLLATIKQWPAETGLQRAALFASAVCEQRGATVLDQSFYDKFKTRWQL